MKSILSVLLTIIFTVSSLAQNPDYIMLEGKVGDHPIVMQLYKAVFSSDEDALYTGSYYYKQYQVPIELHSVEQSQQKLVMEAWTNDNQIREVFDGLVELGDFKGTWTKEDKTLPFKLSVTPKDKFTEVIHLTNYRDVTVLPKGGIKNTTGTCTFNYYLPRDLEVQKQVTKGFDKSFKDFESYSGDKILSFIEGYKKEMSQLEGDISGEVLASLNYETLYTAWPYLDTPEYLVMAFSVYSYTGGAHGNSTMQYVNYDKSTQKLIRLKDILDLNNPEGINNVLNNEVRKRFKIKAGGKLNDPNSESPIYSESLEYSENFAISKYGITFFYDPYTETPYAFGYFSQYVPFSALSPYLNKKFQYNN